MMPGLTVAYNRTRQWRKCLMTMAHFSRSLRAFLLCTETVRRNSGVTVSSSPNARSSRLEKSLEYKRKRRLWLWFVVGFFVVFLGSFLVVTMYAADPSGRGIMQCSLWEYYSNEIPRSFK